MVRLMDCGNQEKTLAEFKFQWKFQSNNRSMEFQKLSRLIFSCVQASERGDRKDSAALRIVGKASSTSAACGASPRTLRVEGGRKRGDACFALNESLRAAHGGALSRRGENSGGRVFRGDFSLSQRRRMSTIPPSREKAIFYQST